MKKIAKMAVLSLAMAATLGAGTVSEAKGSVTKVQITKPTKKSSYTYVRGSKNGKVQLKVKVKVKNGASKDLKYKSSNKKVVSVSKKGVLTLKKAGKAKITVTSKANSKKKDTINITVKQGVTSISAKVKKSVATFNKVVTVVKGKSYNIKTTVKPSNASNKKLTFKSSKTKVAKVSSKGKITAKKAGKSVITIASKDGQCTVKLNLLVAKKITKKAESVTAKLDTTNSILLAGEKVKVKATVAPADASFPTCAFQSSDEKVATVDALTGEVTAVAPGKATITVKVMDGSNKSTTVDVVVGVENKYTTITPVEGAVATAKVTYAGDKSKIAADAEKLILAGVQEGQAKAVTVNGNTDKVFVEGGKVLVGSAKTPLATYIANKTAQDDVVTVSYSANVAKAISAIELATFASKGAGTYTYEIAIDDSKATNLVVAADSIKLTVDGKEYDATVKAGVITVKGDVTADKAIKNLADKKYATVVAKTVRE